jgi:hypothetical protein
MRECDSPDRRPSGILDFHSNALMNEASLTHCMVQYNKFSEQHDGHFP